MDELLDYIDAQIIKFSNVELKVIDSSGDEKEGYDGNDIFDDGYALGNTAAYFDVRKKLCQIIGE